MPACAAALPLPCLTDARPVEKLKDIIQDLYQVMVQTSSYDAMGRPSRDVLAAETKTLSQSLRALHDAAAAADPSRPHPPNGTASAAGGSRSVLPSVPPELVEYVENGRNPDIYTREFVELVRRGNQLMAGKMDAFAEFRDVLAGEMERAMPEVTDDVRKVLDGVGARRDDARNGANGAPAGGDAQS